MARTVVAKPGRPARAVAPITAGHRGWLDATEHLPPKLDLAGRPAGHRGRTSSGGQDSRIVPGVAERQCQETVVC